MENKENLFLIKFMLIITTILFLFASFLYSFVLNNKSYISLENNTYSIKQALLEFNGNLGIPAQLGITSLSYLGIALSSVFDENIKNDMNMINWNIYNTNEDCVVNAKKVSFYKGVPVFKFNHNRAGSFLAIFMTKGKETITTLRHEYGHNIQQLLLGPVKYFLCIMMPSWQEWSNRYYYDRPWEITADIFGGVTIRKHSNSDIQRGFSFLDASALFGNLSYFFLENELNYTN